MHRRYIAPVLLLLAAIFAAGQATPRQLDPSRSTITVHAYKSGLFSFAAHDHTIAAPIAKGTLDEEHGSVELTVNVAEMRVLDPEESEKNRAEIRQTMLGEKLLDSAKFPEITFRSTAVKRAGPVATVEGILTLHGVSRAISFTIHKQGEQYAGSTRVKQTDFGLTPVAVAGGTVKVKDEVMIEFSVAAR